MANSKNEISKKIQLASITLFLLVKYFRNEMVSLLERNGVNLENNYEGGTDDNIVLLMTKLLQVSLSFQKELQQFLQNPEVMEVLAEDMQGNADYYKMSGNSSFYNLTTEAKDLPDDIGYKSEYGLDFGKGDKKEEEKETGDSWWSGIKQNLGGYIGDGIKLLGQFDTNKTNRDIANARAKIALAESEGRVLSAKEKKEIAEENDDEGEDKGISTTTIVVLSLVGVVTIGAVIFFATRNKN